MKPTILTVRENVPLTGDVYRMVLAGDTGEIKRPGQFLNLLIPGFTLRRPISVCDWVAEGLLRHHCRAAARDGRIRDTRTEENHRRCPSWVRT